MADLVAAHRRVMEASIAIVDQVTTADLARPTPCVGWTLADLLAHMMGQNHGFAAAALGTGQDPAVYADRPVIGEPAAEYAASARVVIDAFATPGLIDSTMFLAELLGGITLPASMAIEFHLVDYVAHGWDVAASIGVTAPFDDEALDVALAVAQAVPDGSHGLDDATPFRPKMESISSNRLDQVLARLGRDPEWTPPA